MSVNRSKMVRFWKFLHLFAPLSLKFSKKVSFKVDSCHRTLATVWRSRMISLTKKFSRWQQSANQMSTNWKPPLKSWNDRKLNSSSWKGKYCSLFQEEINTAFSLQCFNSPSLLIFASRKGGGGSFKPLTFCLFERRGKWGRYQR